MANPLSTPGEQGPPEALLERLPFLRVASACNRALFSAEKAFVTGAMLVMSVVVSLDVFERFLRAQRGTLLRMQRDEAVLADLWPIPAVLLILWFLVRSVYRTHPQMQGSPGLQRAAALLTLATVVLFSVLTFVLPSALFMSLLVAGSGAVLVRFEFARPVPIRTPLWHPTRIFHLILIALYVIGGVHVCQTLPAGYSWAQNFALFLLLWTAFIGASMATYQQRHLAIDAVRKIIPARLLPLFNGLSHLLAGLVTAAFIYLAWLYFMLRLGQAHAPGEIPAWLKVLAIPVSLTLVTLRFFGHALVGFLSMALLTPEERTAQATITLDAMTAPQGGAS